MCEIRDTLNANGISDEVILEAISGYLYGIKLLDEELYKALIQQIERDVELSIDNI
jgi:hypothetical protein